MFKIFVLNKKRLTTIALVLVAVILLFWLLPRFIPVLSGSKSADEPRIIHMVTGEFSTTTADGQKIEAYRWDPGTIFVQKGEKVQLRIYGVNGHNHPFVIEGMNIRGDVKKGEETVVNFTAKKKGIYRMVCLTHHDPHNAGPMIAYIIVQ